MKLTSQSNKKNWKSVIDLQFLGTDDDNWILLKTPANNVERNQKPFNM
jgi:hypothetical protein